MPDQNLILAAILTSGLSISCRPPPELPNHKALEECMQSATRPPLPDALVAHLQTIGRPDAVALSDALIEEGTVSLSRRDPYTLPIEPSWREDPYGDPSWVYEYQSLFFVMDALVAHKSTGEDKYLDVAELHIERWLAVHQRPEFRAAWGDHVMANRTRILLWAWELLRARDAESETVEGICQQLALHGWHLSNAEEYTENHNHGFFQDEALLALAFAFEDHPSHAEWLALSKERLALQIEFAVTEEGVQREHSPSYHAGMQQRFAILSRMLAEIAISLRIDVEEVVTSMFEFSTYGVLPTTRAPLIGDSSTWFGSTNSTGITEEALYSLSKGTLGTTPAAVDRVFFESGYAFFRDQWHSAESFEQTVYVGFIAGLFSRTHKHCDDLSVILHGYGESWLTDMGFWSYDPDDLYQELAVSPAGHNVVEVDGRSYFDSYPTTRTSDSGQQLLTDFEIGGDESWVSGEHRLNPGVLFQRKLSYARPGNLRVEDQLHAEDKGNHDYAIYWHLAPNKVVTSMGAGRFLVATESPAGPSMELTVSADASLSCEVIIGADDPYQGWYFPAFLQAEEAPVIVCRQSGKDAAFTTEIELRPATRP